ncbi:MAG: geranylgeranylglyceryl/heptaprenylglyceryl phosphate synthase [Bacteroidetes bacterium]|nr:geranylgeranylglyceryl/heptaprenylglyceryl phosphate synthase [Bacteroidota bacterium]
MTSEIYNQLIQSKQAKNKQLALLVDPDKASSDYINELIHIAISSKVDYFLVGGSLITNGKFDDCVEQLKTQTKIPVIIFPGDNLQLNPFADAILFLTLISGRNPDLLIGQQVKSAPIIKNFGIEYIPTGYMLVDGGNVTSAQYMSNTLPIPANKPDIASTTALAGEMLGLKCIYMDAGSGALNSISTKMIEKVCETIEIPLFVGGGIKTTEQAIKIAQAGADVIVIGTAIEKDLSIISEINAALKQLV